MFSSNFNFNLFRFKKTTSLFYEHIKKEVDNYEEWWKPELLKHGYESVIYGNQTKQYSLSIFYKKEK